MGGQSVNTGSSMGKMLITMLAGFAGFERNMIAERTTAALAYKKAHGEVYNHTPFGFTSQDGSLIPDATEQAAIGDYKGKDATAEVYKLDYAGVEHAPVRAGGARIRGSVWAGKECHQ